MKRFEGLLLILVFIAAQAAPLLAKQKTLYVVTRSTKKFRIGSQEFPSVGLFSTTNDGKTWKHYGWDYTKCFSVSMTRLAGRHLMYLSCGNGVQKSVDDGKTWSITTGAAMTECLKTAIDPKHQETVYAATAYGIYKTEDGGKTWQEKNLGLTSTFTPTVLLDQNQSGMLYCATEAGIHRSANGGDIWEPIGLIGLGIRTLIQHPSNHDIFIAGTENDGVFVSTDHGRTWVQKSGGMTHTTIYALTVDPKDALVIYAGTFRGGIFKTEDGGASWRAINQDLTNMDIHALAIDPENSNKVYAGTLNDGIWLSENAGQSWRFIGLETSQVWDMLFE
ncbi:MAG: WD40/YVTN/BNR-like repeat-containing protein [Candidatus Zhuqueibacterota bacterium]